MSNIRAGIIIFGLSIGLISALPNNRSDTPELRELIQEALNGNPELAAARLRWEAELKKIDQAGVLPDPVFSIAHFGSGIETRLGPQRNKLSVSQNIPFFGKLSIKKKIASGRADIEEENFRRKAADIELRVKEIYYSLSWMDRLLQISRRENAILKRLEKSVIKKYETGRGNQQDILKIQMEITRLLQRIQEIEQGRTALSLQMSDLLNRPPAGDFPAVVSGEPFAIPQGDTERLMLWAESHRPEWKQAEKTIVKDEWNLKLAEKNYLPDFKIMFDYFDIGGGVSGMDNDGRNAWMAGIGINLPLWRKKLHASKAEAALSLKASLSDLSRVKSHTSAKIFEYLYENRFYVDQVELYKNVLIPQAEQTMKASELGYITGNVDFIHVLDSERLLLRTRAAYFKIISDAWKSLARLERIVGKDLQSIFVDPRRSELSLPLEPGRSEGRADQLESGGRS